MRRFWAGLAIAISLAAITAGGVVITQDDADAGTANAYVVVSGAGSCTRSATPIDYATAVSNGWTCGSFDAANDICQSGDTVRIKAGDYADEVITGSNSRSGDHCDMRVADGETVIVDDFEWDTGTATAWINLVGPLTTRTLYVDLTSNSIVDNVTVDGQFLEGDAQILHIESTTSFTFKNGEVKNSCAITGNGAMVWVDPNDGSTTTFDNNEIHDAVSCDPGGDPHTECMYFQNPDNITVTRNRIYRCNVMGIFLTGEDTANNLYIENNYFGRSCGENTDPPECDTPHALPAGIHARTGASPAPVLVDSTIRYNTFRGVLSLGNGASGTNTIQGNIFLAGAPCGLSGTTYSYNAHISGSCGGTGSFNDAGLLSDFLDSDDFAADGGDWRASSSGGGMVNVGNASSYPTLDQEGNTRFDGSAPDIGAYEFQE